VTKREDRRGQKPARAGACMGQCGLFQVLLLYSARQQPGTAAITIGLRR
jgi:hypothetical protein